MFNYHSILTFCFLLVISPALSATSLQGIDAASDSDFYEDGRIAASVSNPGLPLWD